MPGTVHRPECPEVADLLPGRSTDVPPGFGGILLTPGEAEARRATEKVAELSERVTALEAENETLRERIVTVDIDGRVIRFDKVAECEAALAAAEERIAELEAGDSDA
jgi:hypothetical protein